MGKVSCAERHAVPLSAAELAVERREAAKRAAKREAAEARPSKPRKKRTPHEAFAQMEGVLGGKRDRVSDDYLPPRSR